MPKKNIYYPTIFIYKVCYLLNYNIPERFDHN